MLHRLSPLNYHQKGSALSCEHLFSPLFTPTPINKFLNHLPTESGFLFDANEQLKDQHHQPLGKVSLPMNSPVGVQAAEPNK